MDFDLTAEQQELRHVVHEFVANEVRPLAKHTDETGEFNWAAVGKMGPLGLLGIEVPEAYGGSGLDSDQRRANYRRIGLGVRFHSAGYFGPQWVGSWANCGLSEPKNRNSAGSRNWRPAKANWPVWV